jgi:hypothetical protein
MMGFDKSGKAALQEHGAHGQGSYSITFNDVDSLEQFINHKQNNFSTAQHKWLIQTPENQVTE